MNILGSTSKAHADDTYSSSSTDDEVPANTKPRSRANGKALADSDMSDDSEFTEKGTEICQLGEVICAVPSELFDLPDLMKVLSLDTWNYCLTEEDRESLCAFLPDLDEKDFKTTLKELFGGENFHFGSPLHDMFDRMKGGLCQPRVARYREGLRYLQHKEHYHNLRSYHNRMVNTFLEMQKVWDNYPGTEVDERLDMWKLWTLQRQLPQKPLDKKLPVSAKQEAVKRVKAAAKPSQSARKGKGKAILQANEDDVGGKVVGNLDLEPQKGGPKVVLKVKGPPAKGSPVYKPTPKGVLKVVSRGLLKVSPMEKGASLQLKTEIARTDPETSYALDDEDFSLAQVKQEIVEVKKSRPRSSGEKRKRTVPMEPRKRSKPANPMEAILEAEKENRESFRAVHEAVGEEHRLLSLDLSVSLEVDEVEHDREQERLDYPEDMKDADISVEIDDLKKPEKKKMARKGPATGEPKKPKGSKVVTEGGDPGEKPKKIYIRKKPAEKVVKKVKLSKKGKAVKEDEVPLEADSPMEGGPGMEEEAVKEEEEVEEVEALEDEDASREDEFSKVKKKAPKKKNVPSVVEKDTVDEAKAADIEGREQITDAEHGPSEEGQLKAPKKRPIKKKVKVEKDQVSAPESSPNAGSSKEKTTPSSVAKSAKKPTQPIIPTLSSTFPFSIVHLLSAVRVALLLPYQQEEVCPQTNEREARDGAKQIFNLNVPPMLTADGQCLDHVGHPQAGLFCDQRDQATSHFPPQGQQPSSAFYGAQDGNTNLNAYSDREQDLGDRVPDAIDMDLDKRELESPAVPFAEVVKRVQAAPGDPRMFDVEEPMQVLVRGSLKVFSSRAAPHGVKGWKPLAVFDKQRRGWCWVGPLPATIPTEVPIEIPTSAEDWGISPKTLLKLEDMLAAWLKHGQDILRQFVNLPMVPPPPTPNVIDERERFRDFKVQKSLVTICPTSGEMKAFFHREELIRYSLPDRPFAYTRSDGCKAVVAPLRRGGGKPTSKARDHFMLKPDRPPHVTILCLVRDAAARLPGSIGTRADVCALIRDSQFIMEEVSDAQINQVVSGALDRLHYERDPCVRFDGDRKLWVYLHTDREEEDFEDDGTSSTKRWKKPKKDGGDAGLNFDNGSPCGGDMDGGNNLDLDVHSPDGPGDHDDPSSMYLGGAELVYNRSGSLASPLVLGPGMNVSSREEVLPFMELPPSIRAPPLNLNPMNQMPWETAFASENAWGGHHLHSHEHLRDFEYDVEAQRAADAMFEVDAD